MSKLFSTTSLKINCKISLGLQVWGLFNAVTPGRISHSPQVVCTYNSYTDFCKCLYYTCVFIHIFYLYIFLHYNVFPPLRLFNVFIRFEIAVGGRVTSLNDSRIFSV